MAHTPGPWSRAGTQVWDKDRGRLVASCATHLNQLSQDDANARLVEAAPEMLEALKAIMAEVQTESGVVTYPTGQKALAAIAKAEGK